MSYKVDFFRYGVAIGRYRPKGSGYSWTRLFTVSLTPKPWFMIRIGNRKFSLGITGVAGAFEEFNAIYGKENSDNQGGESTT